MHPTNVSVLHKLFKEHLITSITEKNVHTPFDLATPLMGVYHINTSLPSVTNRKAAPRRLSVYTAGDMSIYTGDLKS